ncbi:hypothetical protein PFISCL1PPCAC_26580, partial [Pristionchus fissidentatus]
WPETTICIISNEFCERFSNYGMKTVLTFYIMNVLKFPPDTASILYQSFMVLCFATPLLGSIIADGYIGKFWDHPSVSIIYAIGQVLLAVASTQSYQSSWHPWMDFAGLLIIAFGTGGIKPCVSAFDGDQFDKNQDKMISVYFSMFYFSINAGSMIGSFITPIFRATPCMGQDSCYPLSFGVPAVLMVVATGIFMIGSPWYIKNPPTENVFAEVARIIGGAVGNKFSKKKNTGPREHWLEHYLDTHDCETDPKCLALKGTKKKNKCQKKQYVDDVRALFRLIVMFLPVPMFWALYDQQGSVWTLQGAQMDCQIFGILLLPDQMTTLNAILILTFIPLFQAIIYPIFRKCFNITPLRKMVVGGWLAALSFCITGFVQLQINTTLPLLPAPGQAFASFMNVYDANCNINVWQLDANGVKIGDPFFLGPKKTMVDIPYAGNSTFHVNSGKATFQIEYDGKCINMPETDSEKVTFDLDDKSVNYVAVGPDGIISSPVGTEKPTDGTGEFSMGITLFTADSYNGSLCVCRQDAKDFDANYPCNPRSPSDFYYWEIDYNGGTTDRGDYIPVYGHGSAEPTTTSPVKSVTTYNFKPVKPGHWKLYFLHNLAKDVDHETPPREEIDVSYTGVEFTTNGQGGVYNYVLTGPGDGSDTVLTNTATIYQVVQDNQVNILWQVPQIVVLTAAEILFSVTGYEFCYSQSAPSMKVIVQALWLLTTAIGDSIIIVITILDPFDDIAVQFFVYAGLMFIVICIYALMAIFYFDYQYYTGASDDEEEEEEIQAIDELKSHLNEAFLHELEKRDNAWGIEHDNESIDLRM